MPSDKQSRPIAQSTTFCNKGHFRPLSEVLTGIVQDTASPRISVGDLMVALKDRAFGALILVFAIPNVLPTPPGTSTVLGAPLIFLTAQLALGCDAPWLPRWITGRSVALTDFATLIQRVVPWLGRVERQLQPRFVVLTRPPVKQFLGAVCLLLAVILILPIPLGNMLPALAICVIALAVMESDGAAVLLGLAIAAVSLAVVWGVVLAFILSIEEIVEHTFTL